MTQEHQMISFDWLDQGCTCITDPSCCAYCDGAIETLRLVEELEAENQALKIGAWWMEMALHIQRFDNGLKDACITGLDAKLTRVEKIALHRPRDEAILDVLVG